MSRDNIIVLLSHLRTKHNIISLTGCNAIQYEPLIIQQGFCFLGARFFSCHSV